MFTLGFNSNGLAHHRPLEALALVADLGYGGLALTPDVGQLDPYRLDAREVRAVRAAAEERGLALAIETGARFALDPRRKHHPNLCDPDPGARARRVDHYRRCIDLAAELGAPVVSLWSGAAPSDLVLDATLAPLPAKPPQVEWNEARTYQGLGGSPTFAAKGASVLEGLAEGLARVCHHGTAAGVTVAFEPEPGMFVTRPVGYALVRDAVRARGERLALTLDVGHCAVTGDLPVAAALAPYVADLAHVHLADCPKGQHVHVALGTGGLDLGEALAALRAIDFRGLAAVELSRDAHRGPDAAREALDYLRRFTAIS